jgi:hypothetical protein
VAVDSISDLLGKYNPQPPDEMAAVKRYIFEEFKAESSISIRGETLIITVNSSSLANMLRLRIIQLRKLTGGKKHLVFRIG